MMIGVYRYFSALNPVGEVWAIQITPFWMMLREMGIVPEMEETDAYLKWTSTLSNNPKGNFRTPDRGLVRH